MTFAFLLLHGFLSPALVQVLVGCCVLASLSVTLAGAPVTLLYCLVLFQPESVVKRRDFCAPQHSTPTYLASGDWRIFQLL